MDITKWNPSNPWDDMDKLFSEMMPTSLARQVRGFAPAADVYETKDAVIAEVTIPHIDPDNVEISIKNNVLNIKGTTEKKTEVEEKNYYQKEIRTGSFFRAIPLPASVISDKTSAVHEDGVLKISMPKTKDKKEKTIKIEVKKGKQK